MNLTVMSSAGTWRSQFTNIIRVSLYHVDVYCYPGQPKLHLFKGIFLLEFIVGW